VEVIQHLIQRKGERRKDMNLVESLKLMEKYAECPDCGNSNIGNGEGTLQITDDSFTRTCKCDYKVVVTKTHVSVQSKNYGQIYQR
jgi:iron(III) transport system ATP-binding protein